MEVAHTYDVQLTVSYVVLMANCSSKLGVSTRPYSLVSSERSCLVKYGKECYGTVQLILSTQLSLASTGRFVTVAHGWCKPLACC